MKLRGAPLSNAMLGKSDDDLADMISLRKPLDRSGHINQGIRSIDHARQRTGFEHLPIIRAERVFAWWR